LQYGKKAPVGAFLLFIYLIRLIVPDCSDSSHERLNAIAQAVLLQREVSGL